MGQVSSDPGQRLAPLVRALLELQNGRSVAEVAETMEISAERLGRLVSSLDALVPGENSGSSVVDQEDPELRRLRLENEYLRKQRDLYRKACGLLPVEPPRANGKH